MQSLYVFATSLNLELKLLVVALLSFLYISWEDPLDENLSVEGLEMTSEECKSGGRKEHIEVGSCSSPMGNGMNS